MARVGEPRAKLEALKQAIATIHALTEARLAVRTVVAAPASLLDNWLHETKRWLGFQLPVEVLRSSGAKAYSQVSLFAQKTTGSRILIASYEGLRSHAERLHDRVDLLVCDEGHRLKSGGSLTFQAFAQLAPRRRLVLTGTPIQNDLGELFRTVDFTCPGALGSSAGRP